jgi:hypothetical protein
MASARFEHHVEESELLGSDWPGPDAIPRRQECFLEPMGSGPDRVQNFYQDFEKTISNIVEMERPLDDLEGLAKRYISKIRSQSVEAKFYRLALEWKSRTSHFSTVSKRSMHEAYQRIIGIGPEAIPLILRELKNNPDDWFWALNAITEENPIPEESEGKINEMTKSWLQWGRDNGFDV